MANDFSKTDKAREYLQKSFSIPGTRWGPFFFSSDRPVLEELGRRHDELMADVIRTGDQSWRAPSAWHAAVWLQGLAVLGRTSPRPAKFDQSFLGDGPVCFRGQGNPAWEVTPSIERLEHREYMDVLGYLLSGQLAYFHSQSDYPRLARVDFYPALQHYGIPTHLLDFTFDPLVAVFFAVHGRKPGEPVVVYWLDFESAAQNGMTIQLAPPWVERLYMQRGILVSGIRPASSQILHRLIFPADPEFAQSKLGQLALPLLKEDAWFESFKQEVMKRMAEKQIEALEPFAKKITDAIQWPPFVAESTFPKVIDKWFDRIAEMIEWTCLTKREGKNVFECEIVEFLAMHNQNLFRSLLQADKFAREFVQKELGESQQTPEPPSNPEKLMRNIAAESRFKGYLELATHCLKNADLFKSA